MAKSGLFIGGGDISASVFGKGSSLIGVKACNASACFLWCLSSSLLGRVRAERESLLFGGGGAYFFTLVLTSLSPSLFVNFFPFGGSIGLFFGLFSPVEGGESVSEQDFGGKGGVDFFKAV